MMFKKRPMLAIFTRTPPTYAGWNLPVPPKLGAPKRDFASIAATCIPPLDARNLLKTPFLTNKKLLFHGNFCPIIHFNS